MIDFVVAHLHNDSTGTFVAQWQFIKMIIQMLLDLTLGFGHEAQVSCDTRSAGDNAH